MKKAEQASPNRRLREARRQRYWTQSQVAEQLGTTVVNVNRWESGATIPGLYFRQKLCDLFGKSPEELGLLPETEKQERLGPTLAPARPTLWNVPFRRNPYFTGRQDVLAELEAALQREQAAALAQPQAINGLGGIGKTQTAVEYAYRHQSSYQAVLWAKADSRDMLTIDFVNLAALLNLPEKDEQDQSKAVGAVKRWLRDYADWLLILDNVEDVELASDFLPSDSKGHILLTTRAQSTGMLAQRIELDKMDPEEGALFLLRRTKLLAPHLSLEEARTSDRAKALELAQQMDGLPLALDQAAAYIEETDCGLAGYLGRYQTRHARLLHLRGGAASDHPEPVATTWSLSFEKVEQANPAAADFLRLCAFLHPDAIPEEIITQGGAELGPMLEPIATDPLELDAAISELRKYSLLRRDPEEHLLQTHRLVQVVLQGTLVEAEKRIWAERVVGAVGAAFPEGELTTWQQFERCVPHAQVCTEYIREWNLASPQAVRLLHKLGGYLYKRAQYAQGEQLVRRALEISEQVPDAEGIDKVDLVATLAEFYRTQAKYVQAESHYQQVIKMCEALDPHYPGLMTYFNNLALLYLDQGKYAEAESYFQYAIAIGREAAEAKNYRLVETLYNLGTLYMAQAKYTQAEPLLVESLRAAEEIFGPIHRDVGGVTNCLAFFYKNVGNYGKAEALYKRALSIQEQTVGLNHPNTAQTLNNLAKLYHIQARYKEAEPLYQQAMTIRERLLGSEHPALAQTLHNFGMFYYEQGKYREARHLMERAFMIREHALGPNHDLLIYSLNGLANLSRDEGQEKEAELLYQRALNIGEQTVGPEHPDHATSLNNLANLYLQQGRYTEAETLYQRALRIREQHQGTQHPETAITMHDLAQLREAQGNSEEARALYARALSVREQALGAHHPKTTETRRHLIALLHASGQHEEAAQLEE